MLSDTTPPSSSRASSRPVKDMTQEELPTPSLDDIEDTDKTPSQEKRRKLSRFKCKQCRNAKLKVD
jgi:hypothetical protein